MSEKLTESITFKCTYEEKRDLEAIARSEKKTLSEHIRSLGISNISEVETKKDAEYILYNFGLAQDYKNYLCSSEFAGSETFRKLNAKFHLNFLNSERSVIYTLKIPMSSCK